jgi:hypothetical protein
VSLEREREVAGSHLVQSLLSSHHAQNVTKHTKAYYFLFCMGVKLVSHIERRTLKILENRVREEVANDHRKSHNLELHDLSMLSCIIRIIRYRVLVGKPNGKRLFCIPRYRWEDNTKMGLKQVVWNGAYLIPLAHIEEWWVVVNMVLNL